MGFVLRDPTAQSSTQQTAQLAPRPASLQGLRLTMMDNGKNNARNLLEAVLERVQPELRPSQVIWRNVPATLPAPAELMDEIARETDLVIQAVGD
jgi:hypothetical protein